MRRTNMANLKFETEITALLVIDPYNDFISEGGKVWDRLKGVAELIGSLDEPPRLRPLMRLRDICLVGAATPALTKAGSFAYSPTFSRWVRRAVWSSVQASAALTDDGST